MNIYTVAFFGHRDFIEHQKYEKKLIDFLIELINTKEYVEFIMGRNGEFDIFAATAVKKAQNRAGHANSSLILINPYLTKNDEYYEKYYDEVEICNEAATAHFKAAIEIRNKLMVQRADMIISYITKPEGGAYCAVQKAKKLNKAIINLSEPKLQTCTGDGSLSTTENRPLYT